jgi:hypothetical protein
MPGCRFRNFLACRNTAREHDLVNACFNKRGASRAVCDNNFQNLINETSQEFQPKKDGNYAVIINQGVCIDTSACYSVSGLSVSIVVLKLLDLKLFPNPNNGKFVLYSENGFNNANIKLYNALGNLVFEKLNYSGFNYSIDMSNEIAGIYFIEVIQNNLISKLKLIKN